MNSSLAAAGRVSWRQLSGLPLAILLIVPILVSRLVVVGVALDACGVRRLHYDERAWVVPEPQPFNKATVPSDWAGFGIVNSPGDNELIYRDLSGIRSRFVPEGQALQVPCL